MHPPAEGGPEWSPHGRRYGGVSVPPPEGCWGAGGSQGAQVPAARGHSHLCPPSEPPLPRLLFLGSRSAPLGDAQSRLSGLGVPAHPHGLLGCPPGPAVQAACRYRLGPRQARGPAPAEGGVALSGREGTGLRAAGGCPPEGSRWAEQRGGSAEPPRAGGWGTGTPPCPPWTPGHAGTWGPACGARGLACGGEATWTWRRRRPSGAPPQPGGLARGHLGTGRRRDPEVRESWHACSTAQPTSGAGLPPREPEGCRDTVGVRPRRPLEHTDPGAGPSPPLPSG